MSKYLENYSTGEPADPDLEELLSRAVDVDRPRLLDLVDRDAFGAQWDVAGQSVHFLLGDGHPILL